MKSAKTYIWGVTKMEPTGKEPSKIMKPILFNQLQQYEKVREQVLAEFPDIDDLTLNDTVEGLTTLPEALAAVVRSYLDDLTMTAALGLRISEMRGRQERIEHRAERKRALLTYIMERTDIRRIDQPDFSASLRSTPPQLIVHDEALIPEAFWNPQPPKLDRRRLSTALAVNTPVPGASLGNGGVTISVRTK